jgi:hypothetical protein
MLASSYLIFEANHFKGMWADFTVTTPEFRISLKPVRALVILTEGATTTVVS